EDEFQADGSSLEASIGAADGGGELAASLGLPGPVLADYLSHRGKFLADVIRADLASAPAAPSATPSDAEVKASPSVAIPAPSESIQSRLTQLAANATGFPAESITADLRLLDDLNLDSIKAAEVVSEAATALDVEAALDPSELANATLAEVAAALEAAAGSGPPQAAQPADQFSNRPSWVRTFVV